jgi:hypothetical protein
VAGGVRMIPPPCPLARHSMTKGACSPEVSRLSCHPRRHTHGQLGQWDRRPAAPSAEPGPLVAPGALLNPASEADGRGARPKEIRGAQWGAAESEWGRAATKAHAGKTGPAWWMSRGGSLMRDRVAGEPLGPGMRNPGLLARMGACGLASESRAGRCLANSMLATEVKASAASSAASTPGASWLGSPGAGLSYLSTFGLVLYGQGGARESRAWSHVGQADPKCKEPDSTAVRVAVMRHGRCRPANR